MPIYNAFAAARFPFDVLVGNKGLTVGTELVNGTDKESACQNLGMETWIMESEAEKLAIDPYLDSDHHFWTGIKAHLYKTVVQVLPGLKN